MNDCKLVPVEPEMLPCPFCGGTDALVERQDNCSAYVVCSSMLDEHSCCYAQGPVGIQEDDGEEIPGATAAIAAWNQRAAPAVQGEAVGEVRFELGAPSSIFAELYSKSLPALAPGTKLYTAPQPAEQKPSLQSPPDDPLGGLEHRADGESNFYTLSRPTGNWVARIQFNGELHAHEQERILNAMLSDRNVRYGDGYHQGYWDARQKSPDVTQLVEALEYLIEKYPASRHLKDTCTAALAAYRKGGEV